MVDVVLGEIFAIVSALLSAFSTAISAKALNNAKPLKANLMRVVFAAVPIFPIAFATRELQNMFKDNSCDLGIVIISAIVGYGIAYTLLCKSANQIGVSLSTYISQ